MNKYDLLLKTGGNEKSDRVPISKKKEERHSEEVKGGKVEVTTPEASKSSLVSDKLVSIKLYASSKQKLKKAAFHTNKSQTFLMGELIERYLSELEGELKNES